MPRTFLACSRFSVQRLDPHVFHHGANVPATNLDASAVKLITQHTRPHERMLKMQFVDSPHEIQVGCWQWSGLIIEGASTYSDQLSLFFQ